MIIRSILTGGASLVAFMAFATSPIESIVDSILAADPVLNARAAEYAAAWHDVKAENVLEDPEIAFDHFWSRPDVGCKMNIGISQSFDWPGQYRRRSKLAEATRTAGFSSLAADRADRASELRGAIAEIAYCRDALKLAQYADSLSLAAVNATAEAEKRGLVTKVDLSTMQLERLSVERALRQARNSLDESIVRFESMSGGVVSADMILDRIELPSSADLKPLEVYMEAYKFSPAMTARRERLNEAIAAAHVANGEQMPGFSLGYTYNREFGDNFHGITASMTLPIYSRRSKKAAAEERILAIEAENMAAERPLEPEIRRLHALASQLCEELNEYERRLDQCRLGELLTAQLEARIITEVEYLQQLTIETSLRADQLDIRYEYAVALLSLYAACGIRP